MSQLEKNIAQQIRTIANCRQQNSFPIMSGKVVAGSVDDGNCVCSVVLSVDDADSPTEEVLLNVVLQNGLGFFLLPADGADVLVAELDGPGKYGILQASAYENVSFNGNSTIKFQTSDLQVFMGLGEIRVKKGTQGMFIDGTDVHFNDGSFGGLVKVAALTSKLNALEGKINNLRANVASFVPAGTLADAAALKAAILTGLGAALTVTVQSDVENTAVKHGV